MLIIFLYIVLKNNQPTAVVISVEEYRRTQRRIKVLEAYLEKLDDLFLLAKAEERKNSPTTSFEDFVKEEGFSMDELRKLADEVEIE